MVQKPRAIGGALGVFLHTIEVGSVVRIARPAVLRMLGIGTERPGERVGARLRASLEDCFAPTHLRSSDRHLTFHEREVAGMLGDDPIRRLVLFNPIHDGLEVIRSPGARPAKAVNHARHHEHAHELIHRFGTGQPPGFLVEVLKRLGPAGHVVPAVVSDQLAAACHEAAEVRRREMHSRRSLRQISHPGHGIE